MPSAEFSYPENRQEEEKMERPDIVCHMMMSVDGRIDCNMTVRLPGNRE